MSFKASVQIRCWWDVSSAAFNGSYATNPFNFKNYKCNFAAFYVDAQTVPARPYQPNYDGNNYVDTYIGFVTGIGTRQYPYFNTIISRQEFKDGYCFYVFDLSQQRELQLNSEAKKGNTRLELKFAEALPESVMPLCMQSFLLQW